MGMKKLVVGILAHVDAGKTTLSESLLVNTGVLATAGRVDNKDCFLDTEEMERSRGITIYSKLARFSIADTEYVLVDTPGHVDFGAEMERTLKVLDVAILVISATDGVQSHTKTVWKLLAKAGIPTFIFVNKMDLPGSDRRKCLDNLKSTLSNEIIDFSEENKVNRYEDIATGSEALFDEYMTTGIISLEHISNAINKRLIFPVMFGSALKNEGVTEFIDVFSTYSSPKVYPESFGAVCYKISKDKEGNRLSFIKITGGILKIKDILDGEKVNDIRLYSGDKYTNTGMVVAGDICAIAGIRNSASGKGYGFEPDNVSVTLEPVVTYAVKYPDDVDRNTMHNILLSVQEEEPGLSVEYSEETKEIYVHLMGEVQTEILKAKIEDEYNISISFGVGRILYKETISDVVEGIGHFEPLRHYAEVHLKLEPLEQGAGLEFETEADVNEFALNWQRLVLTHLKEREHRGVLTGSPITDMRITLLSGRAHVKHTEGGDFRQATYRAVRQGLMQASSVLLEPFYRYEMVVPTDSIGRAMTDIDRMCGNSQIISQDDEYATLVGTAPVSTLNGYATVLASYTRGLGTLSVSLAGYEPCHNTEEVLSARNYNPESDLRNTADSVFCSQGVGTVIPWYEVPLYMHLPFSIYEDDSIDKEEISMSLRPERAEIFVTTEEIDELLDKALYANKNGRKGAYKGISRAVRERNRIAERAEEKEVVYKGTKDIKKKIMLIDGYNVVHAWKELSELANVDLNAAAGKLADVVCNYQGMSGIETILVFDAYKVKGHNTEVIDYHNIKIVYTKTAETADHYIERYAHENGKKHSIIVVTSDGVEQVIIRGEGCILMSSKEFEAEVDRANALLRSRSDLWSF